MSYAEIRAKERNLFLTNFILNTQRISSNIPPHKNKLYCTLTALVKYSISQAYNIMTESGRRESKIIFVLIKVLCKFVYLMFGKFHLLRISDLLGDI